VSNIEGWDRKDIIEYQRRLKDLVKKVDFYNNHIDGLMKRIGKLENERNKLTKK